MKITKFVCRKSDAFPGVVSEVVVEVVAEVVEVNLAEVVSTKVVSSKIVVSTYSQLDDLNQRHSCLRMH